jgi:hypothetical protein
MAWKARIMRQAAWLGEMQAEIISGESLSLSRPTVKVYFRFFGKNYL